MYMLIGQCLLITFFHLKISQSAILKIENQEEKLDKIKQDILELGNSINIIAVDLIEDLFESIYDAENFTTPEDEQNKNRKKRETILNVQEGENLENLCQHFRKSEDCNNNVEQVKLLKSELKKLQGIADLLEKQNQVLNDEIKPSIAAPIEKKLEQMNSTKSSLEDAMQHLNETRKLLQLERIRSELLEKEIRNQKLELLNLEKSLKQFTGEDFGSSILGNNNTRSSKFTELRKLLGGDESDDELANTSEIQTRLKELEKRLKKKRQQETLAKEIKTIEQELEGKNDDNVKNLDDLQKAIDKLRPRQEEPSPQFQAVLNKLIAANSESTTKRQDIKNPNLFPYICIMDEGRNLKNVQRFWGPPPIAPAPQRNFVNTAPFPPAEYQQNFEKVRPQYIDRPLIPGPYSPNSPPISPSYPTKSPSSAVPYPIKSLPLPYPVAYATKSPNAGPYQQNLDNDSQSQYRNNLKNQVENLQVTINTLNSNPEYAQNSADKSLITDLEHQVNDLQEMINNPNNSVYRKTRSIDDTNEILDNTAKALLDELPQDNQKQEVFNGLQKKINMLKDQIGKISEVPQRSSANQPLYSLPPQPYNAPITISANDDNYSYKETDLKSSSNDIFTEIVEKIIDKLLAAIPVIIRKLFNFTFDELTSYGNGNSYGYKDNDLVEVFKNLGVFGYFPAILLRLITGFGYFVNILRKNRFFRNFLLPVMVLGMVAGSVLFLIWWLQPDDIPYYYQNNYNGGGNNYGVTSSSSNSDNYQNVEPINNYPVNSVYTKTYLNK